jgi:hypothetical protein
MDAFGLKCMGLKVSFILKLNCFCKNKFFVEIWNPLMLKLVNIRGDNNVQEKKKHRENIFAKWIRGSLDEFEWLECFTL